MGPFDHGNSTFLPMDATRNRCHTIPALRRDGLPTGEAQANLQPQHLQGSRPHCLPQRCGTQVRLIFSTPTPPLPLTRLPPVSATTPSNTSMPPFTKSPGVSFCPSQSAPLSSSYTPDPPSASSSPADLSLSASSSVSSSMAPPYLPSASCSVSPPPLSPPRIPSLSNRVSLWWMEVRFCCHGIRIY